jgi:hypothetical protein
VSPKTGANPNAKSVSYISYGCQEHLRDILCGERVNVDGAEAEDNLVHRGIRRAFGFLL